MDKFNSVTARRPAAIERDVPLHRRISDDLRRQIGSGELRPGDSLPSEHTLVSLYSVSRGTVRQALATLRADGTIGGSRGRPLAVRGPSLTQPLGHLISFTAWIQSLGKQPSGVVVGFGPRHAGEEDAKVFGTRLSSTVYHLVRVRLADHEPLLIERTTFTAQVGELLSDVDLAHESIYAALARQGVVVSSARHLVGAIPAMRADAQLLRVAVRTPLLRVRRTAFLASGEPFEYSDDRYLADRVNFAIENSALVPSMARRLEDYRGD